MVRPGRGAGGLFWKLGRAGNITSAQYDLTMLRGHMSCKIIAWEQARSHLSLSSVLKAQVRTRHRAKIAWDFRETGPGGKEDYLESESL